MIPDNPVKAASNGDILAVMFFALMLGSDLVVSSDGERLGFWATLGGAWVGGASGEVYVLNTDPTNVNVRQVTRLRRT